MATLKEHQAAMVDLLANGSGIPASASRLAHAMHDVLAALHGDPDLVTMAVRESKGLSNLDATTPGLNDKALSKREKTLKTDSSAKWPTPAEQRVKELENTCTQLRKQSAKYRAAIAGMKAELDRLSIYAERNALPEQAGCRKPDTHVCEDIWIPGEDVGRPKGYYVCSKCGDTEL